MRNVAGGQHGEMKLVDLTNEEVEEQRFRQNLERSVIAARAVAAHFRASGYEAEVPALRVRPTFADRHQYNDGGGDVLIWRKGSENKHKVEVKWRSETWTCPEEFKYPMMNIDRVRKKAPVALFYISVNKALTHAMIAKGRDKDKWVIETSTDPKRGYDPYPIYRCPVEYVEFVELRSERPAAAQVRREEGSVTGDGGAPDLQKLVEKYGGYLKIPDDEWTKYNAQLTNAQKRLRVLHRQKGGPFNPNDYALE